MEEREGENEMVLMEAEREKSHARSLPHVFAPSRLVLSVVAHAAAVRPQRAESNASVSSPSLSSEKDLVFQAPFISERTAAIPPLHQHLFHPFSSSSSLLDSGSLLIKITLHFEESVELIITFVFVLDIRSSSDVVKLGFQGSFFWTGGSSVMLPPPLL